MDYFCAIRVQRIFLLRLDTDFSSRVTYWGDKKIRDFFLIRSIAGYFSTRKRLVSPRDRNQPCSGRLIHGSYVPFYFFSKCSIPRRLCVVFGYFSLRVNMAYDNYVVDVTRDCVINLSLPNGAYSGNGRFELKRRPLV